MFGFKKKTVKKIEYDAEKLMPVIRSSICTGEQVGCLKDRHTGKLEELMLIRNEADLREFEEIVGCTDIPKVY